MRFRLTRDERSNLGDRLRAARELADLSQLSVAGEVGATRQAIGKWEDGVVPAAPARKALARLYKVEEKILFAELEARTRAAREILRQPA